MVDATLANGDFQQRHISAHQVASRTFREGTRKSRRVRGEDIPGPTEEELPEEGKPRSLEERGNRRTFSRSYNDTLAFFRITQNNKTHFSGFQRIVTRIRVGLVEPPSYLERATFGVQAHTR